MWLIGIFLAWRITESKKDPWRTYVNRIPFISGILGIGYIILMDLSSPLVIQSGCKGRWDEDFNTLCTTVSDLAYFQPYRVIMPIVFSFVSFGVLVITTNLLRADALDSKTNDVYLLYVAGFLSLVSSLGILGTLVFALHVDVDLHTVFSSLMFLGFSVAQIVVTIYYRKHSLFLYYLLLTLIVIGLSIAYGIAVLEDIAQGKLSVFEHVMICTMLFSLVLHSWVFIKEEDKSTHEFDVSTEDSDSSASAGIEEVTPLSKDKRTDYPNALTCPLLTDS